MQSQMQSLNIERPAEQSSRVIASAILIDRPAAAAAVIPSSCLAPAVLTDYWIYYTVLSNYSDRPPPTDCATATAVPTGYSTAAV